MTVVTITPLNRTRVVPIRFRHTVLQISSVIDTTVLCDAFQSYKMLCFAFMVSFPF